MDPFDLTGVDRFVITHEALAHVESFLQEKGRSGIEALAFLAGTPSSKRRFHVDLPVVPAQTASPVSVRVDPDALLEVEHLLVETARMLAIQIHTHPREARHTKIDEVDTTLPQEGSLSIVVPGYASRGLEGWPECAVYRRRRKGWWPRLSRDEIEDLFEFRER